MDEKRLNTREAAKYLGLAPQTLVNWRARGRGPAFIRFSRSVFYSKSDLDNFVKQSRHRPHTKPETELEWGKEYVQLDRAHDSVDVFESIGRDAESAGMGMSPTCQQIATLAGVEVFLRIGRDVQRLADAAERIAAGLVAGKKK
jgi:hypothetical protein